MITPENIQSTISDLQKTYIDFMLEHLSQWRHWAELSNSMEAGEAVPIEDIPEFFHTEYEWARIVLEMEDQGGFNWNDPRLGKLFAAAAQTPFYKLWGETITEISLRLAHLAGVKTFLETGAGRANLTTVMLEKMTMQKTFLPLFITDTHETVLENIDKLQADYPDIQQETALWDITNPPPEILLHKVTPPVLMYERATLTYANYRTIENIARIADIVVLGDYFNYTGELFGYDRIFGKIGLQPLMFKDIKQILDVHFPNQYIVDQQVTDAVHIPNISLIIAWK